MTIIRLPAGTVAFDPFHLAPFEGLEVRALHPGTEWSPLTKESNPIAFLLVPRVGLPTRWAWLGKQIILSPEPQGEIEIRGVRVAPEAVEIPVVQMVKTSDPRGPVKDDPLAAGVGDFWERHVSGVMGKAQRGLFQEPMTQARLEELRVSKGLLRQAAPGTHRLVTTQDLRDLIAAARLYAVLADATTAGVDWSLHSRDRVIFGAAYLAGGIAEQWEGEKVGLPLDSFAGWFSRKLAEWTKPKASEAPKVDREALIRRLEITLAGKGDSAMVRALSPAEAAALLEGLRATSK